MTVDADRPTVAAATHTTHTSGRAAEIRTDAIGLALSGGGVRAALFSLGVVIGLIHTGCHRRLRCIASVSGGSVVNAVLAHAPSIHTLEDLNERQFKELASSTAKNLALGIWAFDTRTLWAATRYVAAVFARALPPAIGATLTFGAAISGFLDEASPGFVRSQWQRLVRFAEQDWYAPWEWPLPWGWVLGILLVSVIGVALLSRGRFQQAKFDSVLEAIDGPARSIRGRLLVREWSPPRKEGEGPPSATPTGGDDAVLHVLVATDLLSAAPIYVSKEFVYCEPYGWSQPPEKLKTAEALYSSAAFPAVFPPKRLKVSRFSFNYGTTTGELPRTLRLADGGVYNNLGDDWFEVLKDNVEGKDAEQGRVAPSREGHHARLWPFGTLDVRAPRIDIGNVIVVNAGAPSRKVDSIPPFWTVARIMSVLYDNTVRPRLERLNREGRAVIDIKESPLHFAVRLSDAATAVGERARAAAALLAGMGETFWNDLTRDTSSTPTKLSSPGARTGARLMLHGYLSSVVLLHARFGAPLPETLLGDAYFQSLVSGKPQDLPPRAAPITVRNEPA